MGHPNPSLDAPADEKTETEGEEQSKTDSSLPQSSAVRNPAPSSKGARG